MEWPKKVKAESVKISYFYHCENFRQPKVWNIHESVKTSDKEWNLKTRISEHAEQMEFLFFLISHEQELIQKYHQIFPTWLPLEFSSN